MSTLSDETAVRSHGVNSYGSGADTNTSNQRPVYPTAGWRRSTVDHRQRSPLLVEISLSQVTLYGPMPTIRERLTAMVSLLDAWLPNPSDGTTSSRRRSDRTDGND